MNRLSAAAISVLAVVVLSSPSSSAQSSSFEVDADTQTKTSVSVREGDRLEIKATGKWKMGGFIGSCGPDGFSAGSYTDYSIARGIRHGALIVRCGDGEWQRVGSSATITADRDGVLHFSPNDTERGNNDGSLDVTVRTLTKPSTSGGKISVAASTRTTRSGMQVERGQRVSIDTSGSWKMGDFIGSCDAEGMTFPGYEDYNRIKKSKHGSLLVMIAGDDGWYTYEKGMAFTADVSGELLFAPNDNEVKNNSGSITVKVSVTK